MQELYEILLKVIMIITIGVFSNILINLVLGQMYNNNLKKNNNNKSIFTSIRIIKRIKCVLIIVICLVSCLFQIPNFKTVSWSVLSGAGIISLILGYAAQKTLSNFFCGMGIAFSDPFEIGDYVKCVDIDLSGYVEDITLRHTVIRTIDNKRVIIPNSRMDEIVVENYNHTDNEVCRFVEYPISYDSDVDLAMKILKKEMNKLYNPNTNGINKGVEFPKVRVVEWLDSGILIRGWVWGADNQMTHENIFHLNYEIKKQFQKNGIEIPYNYLNVITKKEEKK